MEPQAFSVSEVENLHRLIDGNHADGLLNDEQIKDSDILFFSQYGQLEGTEKNSDFQILRGTVAAANGDSYENSETTNTKIRVTSGCEQKTDDRVAIKKEPFFNLAHAKYRELDGKSTRVFECGVCGKEFGHQYTLMRHLPTHTDERKFQCLTCGKSFRQMSTLSQHRAIHSSERPYVCEVCEKNFNRVSTLISHKKTHTGVKPHICTLCNKAFHQKGNLRNHIFTHTNERPYKCDVCDKGFNQMSNLMCHKMKAHQHRNDIIPNYRCKICGQDFFKRIHLRQHEQIKHEKTAFETVGPNVLDYSNAIIVDPIKTDAMKLAIRSGNTPFALLRPLSGIPVLVRVIPAGDKQMLVPATADDLKKYGHISIRPKVREAKPNEGENKENKGPQSQKTKGCVVQIKVPVVATVIQKTGGLNEPCSMNVMSPGHGDILDERGGPMGDVNTDSFVYTSTLVEDMLGAVEDRTGKSAETDRQIDSFMFDDKYDHLIGSLTDAEIEYVDQSGNILNGNGFQRNMDINSMEFSFDVPHDAQDDAISPIMKTVEQEAKEFSVDMQNAAWSAKTDSSSLVVHPDIPEKIVTEQNE